MKEASIKRQIELEQRSIGNGVERYWRTINKAEVSNLAPAQRLMHTAVAKVADAIQNWLDAPQTAIHYGQSKAILEMIDAHAAAFITAKVCLNNIQYGWGVTQTAIYIGQTIEDNINVERFRHATTIYQGKEIKLSTYVKRVETHQKTKRQTKGKKIYTLKKMATDKGVSLIIFADEMKLKVGLYLIDTFNSITGYTKVITITETSRPVVVNGEIRKPQKIAPRRITKLVATEATEAFLNDGHARCELLAPIYYPMMIPPQPWTTPTQGGYLTLRTRMVRERNPYYQEELTNVEMPTVYAALNAIQATPWKINKRVYEVENALWESNSTLGKLPPRENLKPTAVPDDFDTNPESKMRWKREAQQTHEVNYRLKSKRKAMSEKLTVAEMFLNEETIYFPHNLDWRGRAYPIPTTVNPQADDSGRALLTFATGKKLGAAGLRWLKIHIANCFGVDKVSLDERVKWVDDNVDAISDSADNPLDGMCFWATADKPFNALAGCFELNDALNLSDPTEYISHLCVSVDGSNNGIQHLSMIGRDSVGGKLVNLIAADKPQDIYQVVANAVIEKNNANLESHDERTRELASRWQGNITRKIVKRNVMTLPYGVSRNYGMSDQIKHELLQMRITGSCPFKSDLHGESLYLAKLVADSLDHTVDAACNIMRFLQGVGREVAKQGLPIRWQTPSGFYVQQAYFIQKTKRVTTVIGEMNYRCTLTTEPLGINVEKMSRSVSPNFIHSLDASHMMLSVQACLDQGITSFGMVHDSYGCHASDVDTLVNTLKRVFITMYEDSILSYLLTQLEGQIESLEGIPELPTLGDLDITRVMESDYFFA